MGIATIYGELGIQMKFKDNLYDLFIRYEGEWSGEYRPATRLDPEERIEFELHSYELLLAPQLLEDVIAKAHEEASLDWITFRERGHGSQELTVPVLYKSTHGNWHAGDVCFDRPHAFAEFKLSSISPYDGVLADIIAAAAEEEGETK